MFYACQSTCSLGTYFKMAINEFRMKQTFLILISTAIVYVEAGECCKAYLDHTFTTQSAKWCSGYCCGTAAVGILECCDSFLLQAPSDERTDFCIQWFASNVWAPILIALGGVACVVFFCCCCYQMFCRNTTRVGTVVAPAQQSNVVMMSSAQGTQQPMYGYPTGPQPVGQYPTGSHPVGQYSQGPPPPTGQHPQQDENDMVGQTKSAKDV